MLTIPYLGDLMNHMLQRDEADARLAGQMRQDQPDIDLNTAASQDVLRMRSVHRAVADLKRGTPVVLVGDDSLILVPAETVGARGLAELQALATGPAVLILAATRTAALMQQPAAMGPVKPECTAKAIRLPPSLFTLARLRSMADPTVDQLLPEPPVQTDVPKNAHAALALVKLARLLPAAVAAPTGVDMLSGADRLDLLTVPVADVLAYPASIAADLVRVAEAEVPLQDAPDARVIAFRAPDSGIEHLAILIGRPEISVASGETPLVRLHSECFTGDLLGSLRCDCGAQLRGAIQLMSKQGCGVLLYLAQEGRGIGLVNKLRAYALQDSGLDTLDANRALGWGADERNFLVAATMLDQLGINRIRLLTNNPEKVTALAACGIDIVAREQHIIAPNGVNDGYLATKAARFGHIF